MAKISVILPTYNRAKFLPDSIDSVISQTYPIYELIVIDDGSTDNTREVVERYSENVKYIYQSNLGPAAARNTGLRLAKGDYIAFIDDDDIWLPQKIEIQINYFQKYPYIDFVFGNHANFVSETDKLEAEILNKIIYNYFKKNFNRTVNAFVFLLLENIISTPTVMFKKSCINHIGYMDTNLTCAEDYEYWLRFARNFNIGFIDSILVKRRIHENNIIHDYLLRLKSHLAVLNKVSTYDDLTFITKVILRFAIKKTYYRIGSYYFQEKYYDNAIYYFRQAAPDYFLHLKYLVKLLLTYLKIKF